MSENNGPEHRSGDASSTPPNTPPVSSQPEVDPEQRRAIADAINSILKGIPFIGPYIIIIKLKWGWSGIFLLVGGFLIAAILVATGLFPESVVASKYKAAGQKLQPQAAPPDYELKAQKDIQWDAAVQNARSRIWATGVALSKLDPKLVAERVKAGVAVQLVYVNPCGEAVKKREEDEHNPHASGNIMNVIRKFVDFTKDFDATQKQSLHIMRTDTYPTMVVMIIDSDLYAYFCPYGAECSTSPVLFFKGYREKIPENPAAKFFDNDFAAICSQATMIPDYSKPCSGGAMNSSPPAVSPSPSPSPSVAPISSP
jgi:hypothetical protein